MFKYSIMVFAAFALMDAPSLAMGQDVHSSKRSIRLDDYMNLEGFDARAPKDWSISRDGALAIGISRGSKFRAVFPSEGHDVWVEIAPGQSLTNITNGVTDGSDWRVSLWSPNGDRLALTGNRGGDRALWVWERGTNTLRQVTPQKLGGYGEFFEWTDNDNLLCEVLPPNVASREQRGSLPREMEAAVAGWAKMAAGREPTASVLQTGFNNKDSLASIDQRSQRQLILVNVKNKTSTVIKETYKRHYYQTPSVFLNPTMKFVAISRDGGFLGTITSDGSAASSDLEIRSLDGKHVKLTRSLPTDVLWQTPRWSPNGVELAFFAYGKSRTKAPGLVVVNVVTGHVLERNIDNVLVAQLRDGFYDFAGLEWTEAGDIIFQGTQATVAMIQGGRRDWWLIRRKEFLTDVPRSVTADMKTVPDFTRYSRNGPLVGLADGKLWRVDAGNYSVRRIPTTFVEPVKQIIWPLNDNKKAPHFGRNYIIEREERPQEEVLTIATDDDGKKGSGRFYNINVSSGSSIELQKPTEEAIPVRSDAVMHATLWSDNERSVGASSILWRTRSNIGKPERIVMLNPWMDSIALAGDTIIEYTGIQGDKLKGWVRLPLGYESGKKYPLIIYVYPGLMKGVKEQTKLDSQFEAAAGYVVLQPSMPFADYALVGQSGKRDVYLDFGNGVYPAVDKLVEMGIVDPDRVFVQGASAGGHAVMGLVTQTNRFKAAIAVNGISNIISLDGTFSCAGRYTERLEAMNIGWGSMNSQQRPPKYTPWSDLAMFIRNSPITYAERVKTPVLLVHGDLDCNVPMTQSEEFFSALHRLGKRATFVRYWGEGHGIASPANQRDYIQRVFAWWDEFGDITRDAQGNMIFEKDRVKSRGGRPALKPGDYAKFFFFGTGSETTNRVTIAPKINTRVEAAIYKH